jgi:hypothetical protein
MEHVVPWCKQVAQAQTLLPSKAISHTHRHVTKRQAMRTGQSQPQRQAAGEAQRIEARCQSKVVKSSIDRIRVLTLDTY